MRDESAERRTFLWLVMLAVLAWGSLLALGAALYGFDPGSGTVRYAPRLVRGVIVELCVLGFLGFWMLALARHRRA